MELPEDGRRRAVIEQVRPAVDCGRSALKRVLGEPIEVEADVLVEGHERLACALLHAPAGGSSWLSVPMTSAGEDARAARRRLVLGRPRRQDLPRRQPAHEALRLRALAHRRRTRPPSRYPFPRRGLQPANEQLICYSKASRDGGNVLLVIVNLDPHRTQSGRIDVPLAEWSLEPDSPYRAHELLSGRSFEWQGPAALVTLAPEECPACVFRIERRRSASERDFDYFA